MTSVDEDVAEILGLPSAGFSSGSRAASRRSFRKRLLMGVGVAVAVLAVSARGLVRERRASLPVAHVARPAPAQATKTSYNDGASAAPPLLDGTASSHCGVPAFAAPAPSGSLQADRSAGERLPHIR